MHDFTPNFNHIIDQLAEQGYCVIDHALPEGMLTALQTTALSRLSNGELKLAGTGKDAKLSDLRGDKIAWLETDDDAPAVRDYLALLDTLQVEVNRGLMMGLLDVEAHFAVYEAGQAYRTHIDQFKQAHVSKHLSVGQHMRRALSVISYLNTDWRSDDGGALKLYLDTHEHAPKTEARAMLIEPLGGRMVLFLSDRFWHEVLPANKQRVSVTGWFRSR